MMRAVIYQFYKEVAERIVRDVREKNSAAADRIEVVDSAEAVLAAVADDKPILVVLSLRTPTGFDGYDLARRVKAADPQAVILIFSSAFFVPSDAFFVPSDRELFGFVEKDVVGHNCIVDILLLTEDSYTLNNLRARYAVVQ